MNLKVLNQYSWPIPRVHVTCHGLSLARQLVARAMLGMGMHEALEHANMSSLQGSRIGLDPIHISKVVYAWLLKKNLRE